MNKTLRKLTLVATLLASVTLSRPAAAATTYSDSIGENFTGAGGGILDISSVEVSHDATDLVFKINVTGNPVDTDWGKYMIGIRTGSSGDTNGNGWGRPIKMASGMNYWIGTWLDNGNAVQLSAYSGSWSQIGAVGTFAGGPPLAGLAISKDTSSLTVTVPYAALGLLTNGTFGFDVYTSGGGGSDGAVDALSTSTQSIADWGNSFTTTNNRIYAINDTPPVATNRVFFSVNMEVPITTSQFDPNPSGDLLYVASSAINGGVNISANQLVRVGATSVYTNTLDVVANTNTTIQYRFQSVGFFNEFEVPQLNCGNARSLLITSANMSAPAAYWSDSKLTDPTNTVTFQVDMLFPTAVPPGTNVYVRGDFQGWAGPGLLLTNVPSTTLWAGTLPLPFFPAGGCKPLTYKFLNGTTFESINNRSVNVTTLNPTLASTFNNVEICDVVAETNFVTFTVNMTNAVGTDSLVYDGTQNVYLNGDFAGWWGWGNTNGAATNYLMTLNPGTSNYSITLPFAPASKLRLEYKYSMNGLDNEAGFGQNHVRFIRTTPGQTSYTLPRDNWTGTNANNIANLQEPKFGLLKAVPAGPGQVSVQWLGLKCVQLQASPSLSPVSWISNLGTDGRSSTNLPASGSQNFFRLIDTSP